MIARNQGGPAGAIAAIIVLLDDGKQVEVVSDKTWRATAKEAQGWNSTDFDDSKWDAATEIGLLGSESLPWSGNVNQEVVSAALGGSTGGEFTPEIATNANVQKALRLNESFASQNRWGPGWRSPRMIEGV